jgi:serine/threonine protein kinase
MVQVGMVCVVIGRGIEEGEFMNRSWMDDRYQSVQILSQNSFSQTRLVKDRGMSEDQYCVVKQMRVADQPVALQGIAESVFHQEVSVLEALQGDDRFPALLQTQETGEDLTLIHSWIPGTTLHEEFAGAKLWTQSEVVEFLTQALPVLAVLHSCGFIHGDLKPAHWIRKFPDKQLCLIDFGAARKLDTVEGVAPLYSEFSLGTLGYMAPEQAQGRPRWSSDLYGLGMIALQGITGLDPSHLHQNQQGEWQWQSPIGLPAALVDILTRLVRYRWQDRYAAVPEVLADLKPFTQIKGWQKIRRWFTAPTPSRAPDSNLTPCLPEVSADRASAMVLIHGVGELPKSLIQALAAAITEQGGQFSVMNPLETIDLPRQSRRADLNIVLLSRNVDAQSWLYYHLQSAQALNRSNLLRLIPIHYPLPNPLTEEWGEALQGVRQYLWRSLEDSPAIIQVVSKTLRGLHSEATPIGSAA